MTPWLENLPPELLQVVAYVFGILDARDVLELICTSKTLYAKLRGASEFDLKQHRALTGIRHCILNWWEEAAILAQRRNCGDVTDVFTLAVSYGMYVLVAELLGDPRIDPTVNGNEAIITASEMGRTKIAELLVADPRVDPSDMENKAIRMAAKNGRTEAVALLLTDPRVDPSDCDNEALRNAHENGHTWTLSLLLRDPRVDPFYDSVDFIQRATPGLVQT